MDWLKKNWWVVLAALIGLALFVGAATANDDILPPVASGADDWDHWQHDAAVDFGSFEVSTRLTTGSDYSHIRADWNVWNGLTLRGQYAEFDGVNQGTVGALYRYPVWGALYGEARALVALADDDNHFQLGTEVGLDQSFNSVRFVVYHRPMWVGGLDRSSVSFDGSKSEATVLLRRGRFEFGPTVIAYGDEDYEDFVFVGGTKVRVAW